MHTVICTAGHIDHGKSSLILSLTGYNPDRLKEEQEREMTTDLGFAFYRDDVTFIDVPGHEKFLKTMLAGASGVDGAVLVIAADDGIMPQTREHFEILQLLGIRRGIIALTKIDMVEPEWVELVKDDICSFTAGSFLSDAPILPLSNRTGAGLEEFKAALDELIASTEARRDRGLFRMWIDRAFVLRGSGTVVAGTLLSGSVKIGDRVELLPAGIAARVKRIQVHKQDVSGAGIGQRVALNLPGVEKDQVNRGDLLASPDHYRPTFMINARFLLLSSVPKPLENRTRIRLHLGSSEHIGRMVLLEGSSLAPGVSALVQFRLEDQAMADTGDRFVVRSFSEGRVIGGGMALEIHPRKMKEANPEELERLRRRESAEPTELVRQYLAARGERSAEAAEIAQELAFPVEEVVEILGALRRDGEAVILQGEPKWMAADRARFEELKQAASAYIAEFHAKQPHLKGARRSDLKSRLMPDAAPLFLDRLIGELAEAGIISAEGELIRLRDHQIRFSEDQEALKERIAAAFAARRFQPPEPAELAAELKIAPDKIEPIVAGLVELGVLLKLHDPDGKPLYYHRDAIEAARAILLEFFKSHTEMRFFEFRELIGSTRKFTTPILMHFDDIGITYRIGEVRKMRQG